MDIAPMRCELMAYKTWFGGLGVLGRSALITILIDKG